MKPTVGTPTNPVEAVYAKNIYADNYPHFPIGAFVPFGGNTSIPVGFLLCNGASVARTTYPKLFEILGTTYGAVDDAHFNLPNFTGGTFLEGAETAGEVKEAGLPNIEGKTSHGPESATTSYGTTSAEGCKGAFYPGTVDMRCFAGGGSGYHRALCIDASRSNPIYGNSDTVQPKSVTVRWFVKAFDGASEDSTDLEITNVANDVNSIKNRVYLVESVVNDDGSWYRKYSDGWLKQGGSWTGTMTSANHQTLTLLKPFSNSKYIVLAIDNWYGSSYGHCGILSKTTTTFQWNTTCETVTMMWFACGQGA